MATRLERDPQERNDEPYLEHREDILSLQAGHLIRARLNGRHKVSMLVPHHRLDLRLDTSVRVLNKNTRQNRTSNGPRCDGLLSLRTKGVFLNTAESVTCYKANGTIILAHRGDTVERDPQRYHGKLAGLAGSENQKMVFDWFLRPHSSQSCSKSLTHSAASSLVQRIMSNWIERDISAASSPRGSRHDRSWLRNGWAGFIGTGTTAEAHEIRWKPARPLRACSRLRSIG